MKITHQKVKELSETQLLAVSKLIDSDYDALDFLKLSIEDLKNMEHTIVMLHDDYEAFDAGIIGKYLVGFSLFKEDSPRAISTRTTIIRKEFRGSGYGNKINTYIEDLAKKNGYKKIKCNIYTDNFASLFLKQKIGYLIVGCLRDYDAEGIDEYILVKDI